MLSTHQAQDRLREGKKVFVKFTDRHGATYAVPVVSISPDNTAMVPFDDETGYLIVNKQRVEGFAATAEELDRRGWNETRIFEP